MVLMLLMRRRLSRDMKIKKIKLESFGCLNGEYDLSTEKCNIIIEDNEAGKSTLVDAIAAAFYGLRGADRRRSGSAPIDIYRPWKGDGYAVELTFDTHTIKRDFRTNEAPILNNNTFMEGRGKVGEKLLQMSEEDFRRSFLVCQNEIVADDVSGLAALVQETSMSGTSTEKTTSATAIEKLDSALISYKDRETIQKAGLNSPQVQLRSVIDGLEKQANECHKKMTALVNTLKNKEEQINRLQGVEDQLCGFQVEQAKYQYLGYAAEKVGIEKQLEENKSDNEAVKNLRKELTQLEQYKDFPLADKWEAFISAKDAVVSSYNELTAEKDKYEILMDQKKREGFNVQKFESLQKHFSCLAPDDSEFLDGFNEAHLKRKIESETKTKEYKGHTDRIAAIQATRKKVRGLGIAAGFIGIGLLAVYAVFSSGIAGYIAGGLLLAGGVIGFVMSSTLSADDLARLSQAVETVLKELNGICRDEDSCKSRLSGLRQKLDLPPNIDFIEDYKTYKSLCRQMHEIEGLSEKKETAKKRVFKSAEGLVPLLKDMGVDIMPDDLTLVKVAEWDVQFRQKKRNYERYDEIIKTDIPKIKLLSQDEYVKKIECLNDVNRDIKALLEKHPEFEQLTVSKTAEEYRKEEKMAMNGTTEVTEDKRKLLREVEGVLKEYRERYPTLEEELNMLESKRERLIDFKDAVEKAKKVMEEVSGAVNKQWASDLNIKVNEKLKHLNPQYELSFDTNLSFTIKPKA